MSGRVQNKCISVALPLDPVSLVRLELTPLERGTKIYNRLDLDSWQRAAAEQAIRMVDAGHYPDRNGR